MSIEAELGDIRLLTTDVLPETSMDLFEYLGGSPLFILSEYSKIGELLFIKTKSASSYSVLGSKVSISPGFNLLILRGPLYKTVPELFKLFEYDQVSELLNVEIILLSKFPATALISAGYSPSSVIWYLCSIGSSALKTIFSTCRNYISKSSIFLSNYKYYFILLSYK